MKNTAGYYLSGGIFFVLLTEARGAMPTRRERKNGKKSKITYKNMLEGLIQFFKPSFTQPIGRTFEGNTSEYRSCKVSDGTYLPFDEKTEIRAFDERVKTRYQNVLAKMDEYICTYLDSESEENMQMLIRRLLTIIENDQEISSDTRFYLSESAITKQELLSLDHYCLSNLLLGIWHFIVTSRPDNTLGEATFKALHIRAQEQNAKWKFKDEFGKSFTRSFSFDVLAEPECNNEETPAEESQPVEPKVVKEPRVESYEAPYTDPLTGKQVLAQFHIEARDHGTAIGQVFGGLVIGKRDDKDE